MIVVPTLIVEGGKCLGLGNSTSNNTKDTDNPLEMAQELKQAGFTRIRLVDRDGLSHEDAIQWLVLETIARRTSLEIDFEGGISTAEQLKLALDLGVSKAIIGDIAVKKYGIFRHWVFRYKAQNIILSSKLIGRNIHLEGWNANVKTSILDFIKMYHLIGVRQFMCTDLQEADIRHDERLELYREILKNYRTVKLFIGNGVRNLQDVEDLFLAGCQVAYMDAVAFKGNTDYSDILKFNLLHEGA